MVFNIPPSASERTTTQNRSRELRVFAAKSDADGGAFSVCTAEETLPLLWSSTLLLLDLYKESSVKTGIVKAHERT